MKNKRLIATIAACGLMGALGIGGTMAYLTDTETKQNTFTFGNVEVELLEDQFVADNAKGMMPNEEVSKDPSVKNVGENDAIVFLKVEVPVKNLSVSDPDGSNKTTRNTELFYLKDEAAAITDAKNSFDANWIELTGAEEGTDLSGATRTYVFGYNEKLAKEAETEALFDKVQLKNIVEGTVEGEVNIDVTAYAIQADDIYESDADLTDTLDATNLKKIYDVYVNQSK